MCPMENLAFEKLLKMLMCADVGHNIVKTPANKSQFALSGKFSKFSRVIFLQYIEQYRPI